MKAFGGVFCILVLCCCATLSIAQTFQAQITGVIRDATGALVPNAKVLVKNVGTGLQREATTGSEGEYRVVQLDPGPYRIEASSSGSCGSWVSRSTVV